MMRRAGILIMACLMAAPALASRKSLFMRHRGVGGGPIPDDYGAEAWSWLDFRDLGTLYSDAAATTIATLNVRAIRDKAHGRIWSVSSETAYGECTIVDDGVIGYRWGDGTFTFGAKAPEPMYDGGYAKTNSFCIFLVCRFLYPNTYSDKQYLFCESTERVCGILYSSMSSWHYGTIWTPTRFLDISDVSVSSLVDGGIHIVCMTREQTAGLNGVVAVYIDGRLAGANVQDFNNSDGLVFTPCVGYPTSSQAVFGGPCCEALVYDHIPTNFLQLMRILKQKYGVQ